MEMMRRVLLSLLTFAALPAYAESLYSPDTFRTLTGDRRAHRIGDALTVLVFENSSAAQSADTATEKRGGAGIAVTTQDDEKRANLELRENFNGTGRVQRSGRLLATLTVNVVGYTENGDLYIAGDQQIEVNDEKQHISVHGRVRPVDVSESNTVLSSRIADAKISYIGDGIVGEKQRAGIVSRFLSWLGLL
jgi:flagellar L-ring protein precursor FlgH